MTTTTIELTSTINTIDRQATAKLSNELRTEDLEHVVGGGMSVTKTTDAASPSLFKNCCNGSHIPAVSL